MKVLVTGGAGFIGAHLVVASLAAGDEVVALDNMRRGVRATLPDEARLIEGDIRDRESVALAMRGAQRVYHLAAQSNVLGAVTDTDYSFTSNVIGTYNVLGAARDAGVEQVIFTSSREVYGEVERLPVAEDRPMDPKNAYGASKVAGEVYCRTFQNTYGLDVSVLRLANVYGAGDRDRVIPIWLDRARRGEDLELYGGEQVLDLVTVRARRGGAAPRGGGEPGRAGGQRRERGRYAAARPRQPDRAPAVARGRPARVAGALYRGDALRRRRGAHARPARSRAARRSAGGPCGPMGGRGSSIDEIPLAPILPTSSGGGGLRRAAGRAPPWRQESSINAAGRPPS